MPTSLPKDPTPNDYVRHFRRFYLSLVGGGIALFVLALTLTSYKIGNQVVTAVLLGLGMVVLLIARFIKGGANCPQCGNSLIWKKGSYGTGHASFGIKERCPECDLDLNAPWRPPSEEPPPPAS